MPTDRDYVLPEDVTDLVPDVRCSPEPAPS